MVEGMAAHCAVMQMMPSYVEERVGGVMDNLQFGRLWHTDAHARIRAARDVSGVDQAALQKWVGSDCPVTPWPYGMPTVINPKVIVLGPSPGNSPATGKNAAAPPKSYDPPSFGEFHPKLFYPDSRGFFVKVRQLCSGILGARYGLAEQDALALSGMMNLDIGQFGNASDVRFDSRLVKWVLATIHHKLRPDYLVCLGLKSRVGDVLQGLSPDLDASRPHRMLEFNAYSGRALRYHEWTVPRADGGSMRVVLWPQHPSRPPFSNPELWQASIDEYARSVVALECPNMAANPIER